MKLVVKKKNPTLKEPHLNYKVMLRSYKKEDIEKKRITNPNHKAKSAEFALPRHRWSEFGIFDGTTYEEAKKLVKSANDKEQLEVQLKARANHIDSIQKKDIKLSAYLSPVIRARFEEILMDEERVSYLKFYSTKKGIIWKAVKAMILVIEVNPELYNERKVKIYQYYEQKGWSISYIEKITYMLNRWGSFYCKNTKKFYEKLINPRRNEKWNIVEKYEALGKKSKEAKPLTSIMLKVCKDSFSEEEYRWLSISLYFGLRPIEVENIYDTDLTLIKKQEKINVLWINQTKLQGIKKDKRWKLIPCLFLDQLELLKEIKKKLPISTPSVAKMEKAFGIGFKKYSGRKGFESLLKDKGVSFEAISSYMGHRSVETTWKHYRDIKKAYIDKSIKEIA